MSRARSGRHAGASERISLALEALEPRLLLSGDSLLSSLISPAWFERVPGAISGPLIDTFGTTELSWEGESVEAVRDHWIVQFTDAAVAGINSVTETAGLLSDAVEFEVVQGLGMVGQVLIRTVDASVDAVTSWLSASPSVAQFGPDAIVTLQAIPNDPLFGSMWGLRNVGQLGGTVGADIDAALAWNLATGTSSIVTAVIDTGVDYTHPDLAANMWVNSLEAGGTFGVDDDLNGFIDDIYGWDFYDDDADPMDEEGHGTHVAGTIGAVGNNGIGVTGVNWTASIMAVRFLGPTGGGTTSDAIESVNYATMMKQEFDDGAGDGTPGADVRVTNNSWGGGAFDINLKNAIEASGNEGILFVAAAGNSGVDNDTFSHYPSSYDLDNIIAVAATDRFDQLADFSNFGPVSVDVAAPGVAILSTVPPAVTGQLYDITPSGTSMAAPHVAGIAALAWDYSPTATMEQVRDAILAGVEPLASLTGLIATGGRVNARAVLERVVYADPMFIQTQVVVSGGTTVTVFDVQGRINVGPADVAVKFGSGGIVSSLKILGTGDGMGIVISGAPSVGSVKDARKGTPWLAFLAADSAIKSVKLKTGFGGYNLNGLTLGGIVFGADIDGDGVTTDPIALYSSGAVGKVNLMGDSFGDAYMGGTDSKGLSTRSFKTKRGDFAGDVRGVGGAGKLDIGGNYLGTMAFAAGVSNVRIRGDLGTATPTQLPVPSVSIGDVVVTEGDSGTKNAVFIVTLSAPIADQVWVLYETTDDSATEPTDYTASTGFIQFLPGEVSTTVTVPILGDADVESDETFFVDLLAVLTLNAEIDDGQGLATILNDDGLALPLLTIGDLVVTEGDSGTTDAVFTVTLSAASGDTVTVDYATADDTATAGTDYTAVSGTLTLLAGETSATITVPILGDTDLEDHETFTVDLSSPTNATLGDAQAVGTILNDDGVAALALGGVDVGGSLGRLKVDGTVWYFMSIDVAGGLSKTDVGADFWGTLAVGGSAGKISASRMSGTMEVEGAVKSMDFDFMDAEALGFTGSPALVRVGGMLSRLKVNNSMSGYSAAEFGLVQVLAASIGKVDVGLKPRPAGAGEVVTLGVSAENARILVGTDLGDDWVLGGVGGDADTFNPGTVGSLRVGDGGASNLLVGAGLIPVGGTLNLSWIDLFDAFLFGSSIGKVDIGGSLEGTPTTAGIASYTIESVKIGGAKYPIVQIVDAELVPTQHPLVFTAGD